MSEDRFKIEIQFYDKQLIRIMDRNTKLYWIIDFIDFEQLAKTSYASYKKFKYIFERGERNGIKSNT